MGVRPEKIHLRPADPGVADPAPAGHNTVSGTVVDASFIGVSTQYQISLGGDQEVTVVSQNTGTSPIAPGAAVLLHWDAGHTFALDGSQDVRAGLDDPEAD